MAFGRISGPLLKSNLTRDGVDLAFENNLVYLRVTDSDPNNHKVGIKNDNPLYTLDVGGTVNATTVLAISATFGTVSVTGSFNAGALYDNNSRVATVDGGLSQFTGISTSNLAEGTNLYFTQARARSSLSASGSINYNSTTGAFTYTQGNTDTVSEGTTNLYFTQSRARLALSASGAIGYNSSTGAFTFTQGNTDTVSEGTTNLYFTQARARGALSASGSINYNSTTGAFTYTQGNTDTVSEGTTNKYYTDARARAALSASGSISYNSTTGAFTYTQGNTDTVSEGTSNLYFTIGRARGAISAGTGISYSSSTGVISSTITQYTDAMAVSANTSAIATAKSEAISTAAADATTKANTAESNAKTYADTKVSALVNGSPAALDTLNELATALGDDPNFATTITTLIGTKLATSDFASTFDTRLATKTTTDLAEGTNKYYTDARARGALSASGAISYNSTTGAFTYTQGNTDTVSEGTTNLYFTQARARGALSASGSISYNSTTGAFTYTQGNTDTVTEGTTNKYYTDTRARAAISAGAGISYSSSTGVIASTITQYTDAMAVSATASAIATAKSEAISTSETYTDTKVAALVSGSPAALDTLNELAAALGNDANFSTTVATTIGTKLAISDFASTFDTRLATKTTTNLAEGTNQYFTQARARSSLSATGSISYNSTTGVFSYTQGNTDTVPEGTTNKYYTDARARGAISSTSSALVYNSTTGEFSLSLSGGGGSLGSMAVQDSTSVSITGGSINGTTIGATTPAAGAFTTLSATSTITGDISGNAATVTNGVYTTGSYANPTWITSLAYSKLTGTPDYTAIARGALSASGSISYDSTTGAFTYTQGNTDTVSEGTTNKYYTDARARGAISAGTGISYSSSTGVISSTITQYTDAMAVSANTSAIDLAKSQAINAAATDATTKANTAESNAKAYADTKVAALVNGSPSALDTLNELATALGNDANFSTTITTLIGTKLATADFASTFDTRLATKTTTNLAEGTNKYYTDARARGALSASGAINYNSTTGEFSLALGTMSSQNSSSVSITGGSISGVSGSFTALSSSSTITGDISGNAATVTDGVYTTGSYSDPSWITALSYEKLVDAPSLSVVALTGSYNDLADKPLFGSDSITSGAYIVQLNSTDGSLHIPGKVSVGIDGGMFSLSASYPGFPADFDRGDIKTHPTDNNSIVATVTSSWSQRAKTGIALLTTDATDLVVGVEGSYSVSPTRITNVSYSSGTYTITFNQSVSTGLNNWPVSLFDFNVISTLKTWQFTDTGTIIFPDSSVQSTAMNIESVRNSISVAGTTGEVFVAGTDYSIPGFEITGNNFVKVYPGDWTDPTKLSTIVSLVPGSQLDIYAHLASGSNGHSTVTLTGNWVNFGPYYQAAITTSVPVSDFYAYEVSVIHTGSLSYNSSNGRFTFIEPTTDTVTEGSNLYFTNARALAALPDQTSHPYGYLSNDGSGNLTWQTFPTLFDGDYNSLLNKPTVPSIGNFSFSDNILTVAASNTFTTIFQGNSDFWGAATYWGSMGGNELRIIAQSASGIPSPAMVALSSAGPGSQITITDGTHSATITIDSNGWVDNGTHGDGDNYYWLCHTVETNSHAFSWFNGITKFAMGAGSLAASNWVFDNSLTFPDDTIQNTAWLGTYSYNNLTDKPSLYSSAYIGTTNLDFTRTSASQTLTGVSIDGNAGTVTNGVYTTDTGTVTNTMLAGGIANSKLANSTITINGTTVALGGSASLSITNQPLAISLAFTLNGSGGTYDGTSSKTLDVNTAVVATLQDTQTLTNKSMKYMRIVDGADAHKQLIFDLTQLTSYSNPAQVTSVAVPTNGGTLVTFDISGNVNLPSSSVTNSMLAGNIANNKLANSTITINGTAVALGGSITVSGGGGGSTTINPLTVGAGLVLDVGTSYDGSASRTISISSNVATTSGTQTLSNKTISGMSNIFSDIPNSALLNNSISINGTTVPLGGSISGLASSSDLANSYITINGSHITLGNGISGLAATANNLTQFATTTSAQLASIISGKTGTGSLVFASVSGTPSSGQALLWNGTTWTPGNVSASIGSYSIDALSDVDTVTHAPTTGQALVWDGTKWMPGDVSSSGGGAAGGGTARLLDTIIPDGSTSTFELRYDGDLITPTSSAALIVSIDGVWQVPESAYTVLGSIITFAGAIDVGSSVAIVEQGGSGASALSDLTDVTLSTLTDGQALVWDATAGKWVNGSGGFLEGTTTIATAGTVTADTFSASAYSTAKYLIQATAVADIHSTELTVIHNGTTAYSVEYGTINTADLMSVAVSLVAGEILVNITTTIDNTTIDFKRVSIVSRLAPSGFDLEGELMSGSGTVDLESGSGTYDLMGTTTEDMALGTGTEDMSSGTGSLDLMV